MCEPVSMAVATTALGIGSSVMGYSAQQDQYKATERNYWQNWSNTMTGYQQDVRAVGERQMQEQTGTAQRKFALQQDYDAKAATVRTAGTEAGLTGLSFDAIMNDLGGQQDTRLGAEDTQLGVNLQQLQDQKSGLVTAGANRINSAPRGQKPNPWALALQIGGNVLSGASTYNGIQAKTIRANAA